MKFDSNIHNFENLIIQSSNFNTPPPPPTYIMNRVQKGINTKTRGSKVFLLQKKMLEIGKEVGILLNLSCLQQT